MYPFRPSRKYLFGLVTITFFAAIFLIRQVSGIGEVLAAPSIFSGGMKIFLPFIDNEISGVAHLYETDQLQTRPALEPSKLISTTINSVLPTQPASTPTPVKPAILPPENPDAPPNSSNAIASASPIPDGIPQPVGLSGNWNLVFQDEFDGDALINSKWHTCFWWADATCTIESNHELELYNPEDILVQGGILHLRAQKRDMTAWNGNIYHYTSGMIMTGGRQGSIDPGFTFTYGYVEALIRVPAGKGLWPAFWMLPQSYDSRPEIDIMEILGHAPNVYNMNYHYIGGDSGSEWSGPDFSAGWHVIGLDWEPDALVWYVDGVERYRITNKANISNEPEYLLLNLAVGGDWPGSPDSNTPFPSTFDVDYVRVWQK
jgi:beta-glucanase (GH16 family)